MGRYAAINGLDLYYEIYGAGLPLILLHGGIGLGAMFAPIMPQLSAGRQVIPVDLQGHGHTADIDRPFSLEVFADDIASLIEHLGFERADVMGYSMGAGVAMQTAIRHPDDVRKLVIVSAPCRRDAWYPEVRAGLDQMGAAAAEMMKQSPIYRAYAGAAPRPEDWPVLLAKTGELVRRDYDYCADFAAIKSPVLIAAGDADSISPRHLVEMFEMLGGGQGDAGWDGSGVMSDSRLAILPGTTHYNSFMSPLLVAAVNAFLDEPMPGAG
jgi:pimeloyl-ACP methyl ester carboxylesterase